MGAGQDISMRRLLIVLSGIIVVAVFAARLWSNTAVNCTLPREPVRPLDLQNPSDRQHLDADRALIRRTAERYREYIRTVPRESDWIQARQAYATRPDRAYDYCVAILSEQLAAVHPTPR
jgi:hypothetical protein